MYVNIAWETANFPTCYVQKLELKYETQTRTDQNKQHRVPSIHLFEFFLFWVKKFI